MVLIALMVSACVPSEAPPTLRLNVSTPILTLAPIDPPTSTPAVSVLTARPIDPAVNALRDEVASDRLMANINALVGFTTRHMLSTRTESQRGIGAARDWLVAQFKVIAATSGNSESKVETQSFQYVWRIWDNMQGDNVVLTLPGAEATAVIVAANYDSVGNDPFDGQTAAPGANSNGSGVAVLLELARLMAPLKHRATLIFVALAAKETGSQGSAAFLDTYAKIAGKSAASTAALPIQALINVDTLGSATNGADTDTRTMRLFANGPQNSASRQLARQLGFFINSYISDLTLTVRPNDERGTFDYLPFANQGLPAVRVTQGIDPASDERGARDTADKIEPDYLVRVTRAILVGLVLIADGPASPGRFSMQPSADRARYALVWASVSGVAGYIVALRKADSANLDQLISVADQSRFEWDKFTQYAYVSVASVTSAGRIGPFSEEVEITKLGVP